MNVTIDVVTGAFSYSGAAIARRLQQRGHHIITLTGHPDRAPAGTDIDVHPMNFADPATLTTAMTGANTLYNTYWIRFADQRRGHQTAVKNCHALFEAAARAGVQRIVHVSITHPSLDSSYSYFRGKAEVEQLLANTGIPYGIARPAVLFGQGGVLVNNIAWLLRRLPVFAIGGRGQYRIRPIHVDDLARLCVDLGAGSQSSVVDAVGPQNLAFRQLVEAIRTAVGSNSFLVPVPGAVLGALSHTLGTLLRDELLTRDEYHAMTDGKADSTAPTTGQTMLTDWLVEHGPHLGRRYSNELDLHYRAV